MLLNRFMDDMMGMGGGMVMGNYNCQLKAYSVPFMVHADSEKVNEINNGGKIIMPQSALDQLIRRHIEYPMMFKISNPNPDNQRATHCGVLQFDAEEGKCYLPNWMMRQLFLEEGSPVYVEYKNLPKATYAKFKPQSTEFLELSNPRAIVAIFASCLGCVAQLGAPPETHWAWICWIYIPSQVQSFNFSVISFVPTLCNAISRPTLRKNRAWTNLSKLEIKLRNFSCLTKGDVLAFEYNGKVFEFLVQEVKPGVAVSITECDMNVEFDAPEGYTEPDYKKEEQRAGSSRNSSTANLEALASLQQAAVAAAASAASGGAGHFVAFSGEGCRLDGKSKATASRRRLNSSVSDAVSTTTVAADGGAQNGVVDAASLPVTAEVGGGLVAPDGSFLAVLPVAPDYDARPTRLPFNRHYRNKAALERDRQQAAAQAAEGTNVVAFSGMGRTLRQPKTTNN